MLKNTPEAKPASAPEPPLATSGGNEVAPIGSPLTDPRGNNAARGLSGRLLVLTMAFVMLAEVLIFVPSVANFRNVWLQNHLTTAETASIVYLDATDAMLSLKAQEELLAATESVNVSIKENGMSRLMASRDIDTPVTEHIALDEMNAFSSLKSTLSTLFFGGNRAYHVSGRMKSRDAEIHLIQEDRYLRSALLEYSRNILLISLVISLFTATLVFLALYWMIVRPIINISQNMDEFSKTPESANLVYQPTGRSDEIGIAEERLAALQSDLQTTLRQKKHLADLGLAVSKINHDLRNILASAQLFSDRLVQLPDPTVQRLAPKLLRTIDRAVEYTRAVLAYGKATESKPQLRVHRLHSIVEDVADSLALGTHELQKAETGNDPAQGIPSTSSQHPVIEWQNRVPDSLEVHADSEQLFRVILNICRNAVQAMRQETDSTSPRCLSVHAAEEDGFTCIRIADTGPGIPEHQAVKLFEAFQGSSHSGGTGLGLAIASELAKAHGGSIELEKSSPAGSVFLIRLPQANA